MFWKKRGLRNFRREQTLEQKRLWNRCFPVNFRKFLRTLFLTEHLWWLPLHQFEIEKVGIARFQIILWNFAVFLKSYRNSPPYVFWEKEVLKICSKFTGEPPCRNVISINKAVLQVYWNHSSAWVFSSKFAAYFQSAFFRSPLGECSWD